MSNKDLDDLQPITVTTTSNTGVVQPIRIGNPNIASSPAKQEVTTSKVTANELLSFEEFLKTDEFKKAVMDVSNKTGVPALTIAEEYTKKFLGTISDTGITAVTTVEEFIDNVLDVVHCTLKGTNHAISGLGKGVISTVTLNKKLDK